MSKKPPPPQFPKIIEGVPFLDAAGPARDWSAAAQEFLKHCAPSNVSIAETEQLLRQLYPLYCAGCHDDKYVAENKQRVTDFRRGYGEHTNSLAGYIKKKRGLRELMAGFFRAMDAKNARDDAVVRADIKQKYGTKVLDKVMPRDRRKKALGARPQPKAAKALNVPATKLRAHLSGNKDLSATHKRLADYEAVKGVKAIGDYLCGNREFVRLKACVEVFLKTADPDRFDPSKKTSLAFSAKRDLPSRFFYRDFKDELAKNQR